MGYTTEFSGELKFNQELTAKELAYLKQYLGEDPREHKEWEFDGDLSYIQFELNDDFTGIRWDGGEKFYYAVEAVNFLSKEMRKLKPTFAFKGQLLAQGEEIDDRWNLKMKDGVAINVPITPNGEKVRCPHCHEEFFTGDAE